MRILGAKAPKTAKEHFHENLSKIHTQNPATTPLSDGQHASGSKPSSWLGAVDVDKAAGLACSSVHPLLEVL